MFTGLGDLGDSSCPAGQVPVDVGADSPVCMTSAEAVAYGQSLNPPGVQPSSSPCGPGEALTNVGGDNPVCLTPAQAVAFGVGFGQANQSISSALSNLPWWVWAAGGLLIVLGSAGGYARGRR